MIYIGSARHDENGNITGGSAGDQLQTSSNDTSGEVSMQEMYTHSKGWYILRPKDVTHADKIAERMEAACNNANIGYDQNQRDGIVTYGIDTTTKCECDCSSLMRVVVKEATGIDPGNFTTANEVTVLMATDLFDNRGTYSAQSKTPVYNGDVLVTQSKGHTVAVVSGNPRSDSTATISTLSGEITLNKTALYASSTATKKASTKTGTYYIWSEETVNGRIRITNKASNVGVTGQITGWVNTADISSTSSGSGSSSSGSSSSSSSSSSSKSSSGSSSSAPTYKVGSTYTLKVDRLTVRKSAGTSSAAVSYSNLTDNAKANAYSNGTLKKGTKVTCKATKTVGSDIWMQIPSGWIAAWYNGETYVG